MSALVCSCGLALDPDAPGADCAVCNAERPSPAPRASSRGLSSFARVALTAVALADDERRDLSEAHLALAASIHRSPIEA